MSILINKTTFIQLCVLENYYCEYYRCFDAVVIFSLNFPINSMRNVAHKCIYNIIQTQSHRKSNHARGNKKDKSIKAS